MSDGRDKFLVSGPTTAVSGMSLGYKECCNWRQCRCGLTRDQPCDCGADARTRNSVICWERTPVWSPLFVPVWLNTTVNIDKCSRQPQECSNCRKCRDYPEQRVKKTECVCYRVSSYSVCRVIRPESSCFRLDRVTSSRLLPYQCHHWPLTLLITVLCSRDTVFKLCSECHDHTVHY